MERVPEPELMDAPDETRAYSEADFADAHDTYVRNVAASLGVLRGRVLDLGCGPGDVTVRFARTNPDCTIVAVDAGQNMLALARERVAREGLTERITFEQRYLPDATLARAAFDAVVSSSVLHHLADPTTMWTTVLQCAAPGAAVAIGDLLRPATQAQLDALVDDHTAGAPELLRRDFAWSLAAAYTVDEVRAQLVSAGLDTLDVRATTDRHLLVTGRLPA